MEMQIVNATDEVRSQYKAALRTYREEARRDPIANRFPWHGELAVTELLDFARQKQAELLLINAKKRPAPVQVRLITGTSPDRVYGLLASRAFDAFLDVGGCVRVLIWNDKPECCGGELQKKVEKYKDRLSIRLSKTMEFSEQIRHFLVVDKVAYRLESPHAPFDTAAAFDDFSPEIPARICFNDPAGAARLVEYFDSLWSAVPNLSPLESAALVR